MQWQKFGFVILRDFLCVLCGKIITTKGTKVLHKAHKGAKTQSFLLGLV